MSLAYTTSAIEYPSGDGSSIAENTLQYEWIVTIQGSLDRLFRHDPNVFVAGDLLWYPVEGNNRLCYAPDTMVVIGRPKGHRCSYMQWCEAGVAPQVVFEVLSPSYRIGEMNRKYAFYERYGVEEYYIIDPDQHTLDGWFRRGSRLQPIDDFPGWVSPELGIRFQVSPGEFVRLYQPDGQPFLSYLQVCAQVEQSQQLVQQATALELAALARAEKQTARAEREAARAEKEAARAERLAAKLTALGVESDEEGL